MSSSLLFRRAAAAPASLRAFSTSSPRSLARVTIIGNLADSPELHSTGTGREVVRYSVASTTGGRDNRKTSWFRVASFAEGGSRDHLMNLPKGSRVFVEGDISTSNYVDAQGTQRSSVSVLQRSIYVLNRSNVEHQSAEGEESEQQ